MSFWGVRDSRLGTVLQLHECLYNAELQSTRLKKTPTVAHCIFHSSLLKLQGFVSFDASFFFSSFKLKPYAFCIV